MAACYAGSAHAPRSRGLRPHAPNRLARGPMLANERCYRSRMPEPVASAAPSTRPSTAATGPARARARLAAAASALAGAVTDAGTPRATAAPGATIPRATRGELPGSSLRREILLALRRVGPASPDELSRDIGASRSGIVG